MDVVFDWRWRLIEKIWYYFDKVSADSRKEFNREPVYHKKFLKTKIKSYSDEATGFYDKEIPKMDSNHTCSAVTSLNSALDKDGSYYRQVLLKEYKYIEKEKDVIRQINDDLMDFSYPDESDEE